MPMLHQTPPQFWSIILAGKEEYSTPPFIERWLGYRKPKPFCTFVGSRSMLQHTWDRADQLSHPNCKITIVGKSYLHETCSQLGGRVPGMILTEPHHCGMMASLFLALTYLQTKQPDTIVVAYPADHFIYPEDVFLRTIQRAVWAAERLPDHMILVGVGPNPPDADIQLDRQLGWVFTSPIYAAKAPGNTVFPHEGTSDGTRGNFFRTSVIVSRSELLWMLGWERLPFVMELFEDFKGAIGTSYEKAELKSLFDHLQRNAFSLHSLIQNSDHLAVMELEGVTWNEWETPGQIIEDLATIGKHPTFPLKSPTLTGR